MSQTQITLAALVAGSTIDRKAGIIRGVSVITAGPAIGHGLQIDSTCLSQVAACGARFRDGVRVKIEHGTGFDSIVGTLKHFRVEGNHVRADLHLIFASPKFSSILEMAEKMPAAFGLSIAFSGTPESTGGNKLARCTELYSVDLVDYPAANPSGLFSQPSPVNWTEKCKAAKKL